LNSRFEVVAGATWSWVVRKSRSWEPSPKYTASMSPEPPLPIIVESTERRA
jgi:hypothetical protein